LYYINIKYLNLTVPVAELMGGKPPAQLSLGNNVDTLV